MASYVVNVTGACRQTGQRQVFRVSVDALRRQVAVDAACLAVCHLVRGAYGVVVDGPADPAPRPKPVHQWPAWQGEKPQPKPQPRTRRAPTFTPKDEARLQLALQDVQPTRFRSWRAHRALTVEEATARRLDADAAGLWPDRGPYDLRHLERTHADLVRAPAEWPDDWCMGPDVLCGQPDRECEDVDAAPATFRPLRWYEPSRRKRQVTRKQP